MRHLAAVLGLAFAIVRPLAAQTPPVFELDELVVTGTPIPRAAAAMGAHVTVIDGDDLRTRGVTSVVDALREVSGITVVQAGSFGSVASVFMRGGESDYVQVLVDGVPVNQPGGAFDFSTLSLEHVERIEVVRGPASALYGSDAVAGVIQVISGTGAGRPHGSAGFRGGSFGTRDWIGDLKGGTASVSYGVSLSRRDTDGVLAFNNRFERTVLNGTVRLAPDDATSLAVTTRIGSREFHYPTDGSGNPVDTNAFTFGDDASVAVDGGRRLGARLELQASIRSYRSEGGTDDRSDGPADSLGFFAYKSLDAVRTTSAELRSNLTLSSSTVGTLGIEVERESQRSFSESQSEFGSSGGESRYRRANRAAFGHLVADIGPLALSGGTRVEDNERFGRLATWQLGASYALGGFARIRGSLGRGIKEPTFLENYSTGYARGNPDLDPERSFSWEVGVEQSIAADAARVQVTWFDQSFRDLIQYTVAPPSPEDPNYFNVAQAAARGVEASVDVALEGLTASADLTWLDTEVIDAGFATGPGDAFVEGEPLLRRPEWTLGGSLRYRLRGLADVTASVRHVGERADRDFATYPATPVSLAAYTMLSVGGEVELWTAAAGRPGLALTVRGENLLDTHYEEAFGFPAPGRGLYVGGRMTFGDR